MDMVTLDPGRHFGLLAVIKVNGLQISHLV